MNKRFYLFILFISRLRESEHDIETLQKTNSELAASLDFVCNKMDEFQKVSSTNDDMFRRLRSIEDDCIMTRNRVDVLDNKSRNKNIRIINIKENDNENQEQLRFKVDSIIKQTGTQCCSVAAFRVGNPRQSAGGSGPKPRPIIATLSSEQDRSNVLRSAYKLKNMNEGIYIQDDVCLNTVLERQKQMDEFRRLKTQYQTVYFRGHTLKYKGRKQPQQQQHFNRHVNADFPRISQHQHRQLKPLNKQQQQIQLQQQQQQNNNTNRHASVGSTGDNSKKSQLDSQGKQSSQQHRRGVHHQQQQAKAEQVDHPQPAAPAVDAGKGSSDVSCSSSGRSGICGRDAFEESSEINQSKACGSEPNEAVSVKERPRRSPRECRPKTHQYGEVVL